MANAKGAVLLGPVKFLRKRRDAARERPARSRCTTISSRTSGCRAGIPESDFVALIRACARLMPGDSTPRSSRWAWSARRAHAEVYGDLLRSVKSNSSVFALWSTQHDTGELRGVWESPTSARVELVDFAAPVARDLPARNGLPARRLPAERHDDVAVEKRRAWRSALTAACGA